MRARFRFWPVGIHLAAAALFAGAACAAMAQGELPADPTVDDILARLAPVTKAFRPTARPDITTNACAEAAGSSKNLVVVPYAAEGSPSIDLPITFATGSDQLTPDDRRRLNVVAQAMRHASLRDAPERS